MDVGRMGNFYDLYGSVFSMKGFLLRFKAVILAFVIGSVFTHLDGYRIVGDSTGDLFDRLLNNVEKELDIEVPRI